MLVPFVKLLPNSWNLVATPIGMVGRRKTAHYVIDTRDNSPERIAALEDYLYGSDYNGPQLPLPEEVLNILNGHRKTYPGNIYPSSLLFPLEGN